MTISLKTGIALGASLAALACATAAPAWAQETPVAGTGQTPPPEGQPAAQTPEQQLQQDSAQQAGAGSGSGSGDIVVTGSRIGSGFSAPTPLTMVSAQDLKGAAPNNLADGLNKLPVFLGSIVTNYPTTTTQPGATAGQNLLGLRRLGPGRTLVLLDGRRVVATNGGGGTDVNIFPQTLVSRVDVVTGGASAAYGSDAISGVVNFVLDTKFTGVKAEIKKGISTYGDLPSYGGSIAFGIGGGGRARLIGSAEYYEQKGLGQDDVTGRSWYDTSVGRVPNPNGTTPSRIIIPDIRISTGSNGGLITGGPLKGTQFLGDGRTGPFNYGTLTGTAFQSGGDGGKATVGLKPDEDRYNAFLHGEFDLTPGITLFAEGLYAHSHTNQHAFYNLSIGSSNQYTIFADNAYLPAQIKTAMANAKITQFTLGRVETDLPITRIESDLDAYRWAVGARGDIAGSWKFDTSYTWSRARQFLNETGLTNANKLYASADAVVNPANGQIVCRSALPGGVNPDCVPRNLFGVQQPNPAAAAYVTGDSYQTLTLTQQVADFNIRGDLGESFQLGAGPIGIAAGFEYRNEDARQTSDAISQSLVSFTGVRGGPASLAGKLGPYRHNNPQPFAGSYDIKEGYLEVALPVLKDLPFARALDLNGAVRHAIYSTGTGAVTTWKIGANYLIIDAIRLRGTRSRDIRSANTLELFNPISQITNNTIYQGKSVSTLNIASGNTDLKPEVADTLTFGAVVRPFQGFQMSLDYYDIDIKDAIGSIGSQRIIDECGKGNQALCDLITVTPQNTLVILNPTLNLSRLKNAGYDFEAQYTVPALAGTVSLRTLVNYRTKDYTQTLGSAPNYTLNTPSSPRWRGTVSARYATQDFSFFTQARWQGASALDPNLTIDRNHVPAVAYVDMSATYDFHTFGGKQQLFFNIDNLFNRAPPISPPDVTTFTRPADPAYDPIGRYFTMGFRVIF